MFKRGFIVSFIVVFFVFSVSVLYAIDGKTLVKMNKKAVAAGGVNFGDLNNFSLTGTVQQYGLTGGAGIYASGGDSFSVERDFGTFAIKIVLRGSSGSIKEFTGWVRSLSGGEYSDFKVLHYMLAYRYLKASLSLPEVTKEDANNIYAVIYAPRNIKVVAVFDKTSSLLKNFSFINSSFENVRVYINEYRTVEGFKLPSKISVEDENPAIYSFSRIEVNQGVDSARFTIKPEEKNYSLPQTGVVRIPIDTYFGLPFVKVWVGNSPALTFLLDTDLPFSVIDQSIAKQLGYKPSGKIKLFTRYLPEEFSVVKVPSVLVREVEYKNRVLLTTNMLPPSINVQMPIHGILGADFFNQNILRLDLNTGNIEFMYLSSLNQIKTGLEFLSQRREEYILCRRILVKTV